MSKPFNSFKECRDCCKQFGFNEDITAETLWNEGYRLGRSRWHWGPWWWVNVIGWFNTMKSRLRGEK